MSSTSGRSSLLDDFDTEVFVVLGRKRKYCGYRLPLLYPKPLMERMLHSPKPPKSGQIQHFSSLRWCQKSLNPTLY